MSRLSFCAAVLLASAALAACSGGSQPQAGALPQTNATASLRTGAHRSSTASYQQLYRFHPQKDGTHPEAGLLDVGGTLYGTTAAGGLAGNGTVYTITPSGVHTVIYRFHGGSDGRNPVSPLVDVNGTLYGMTLRGGPSGAGTVYTIGASGEKVLYAFKGGSDGAHPHGGLIDVKGTLYGTTWNGGGSGCYSSLGCGTVFSLTTSGQESVLHRFGSGSDGTLPNGDLIDVKGVLYGTTAGGGNCSSSGDCGTVYTITPGGTEKVLYSFKGGTDGNTPLSGLIAVNGVLYGTTNNGGQGGSDCYGDGCGTVYGITPAGAESVLHRFTDGSDGAQPQAALVDVDGVLYGTTTLGGEGGSCFRVKGNCGTVFSITTAGVETVLYRFAGGTDGWNPAAPLANVDGTLYGTTYFGGDRDVCCHTYGWGTVYSISP